MPGRPPLLVVVTGAPGSGKTTLAEPLARELGLPLLAKDAFKERLADALGHGDRDWSRRLGAAVYPLLFHVLGELVGAGASAVVESNFSRSSEAGFATLPPARIVQVLCEAPPEAIEARYGGRAARHPIHYDEEALPEILARIGRGEWEALELPGRLIRVDTTSPVDVQDLARRIPR